MDCTEARGLIELELEDALKADDLRALDEHASACRECAALRAQLAAIDGALFADRLERAPAGLAAAVAAAVARREARQVPEQAVIAVAAAAGLAGAGYGIARAMGGADGAAVRWVRGLVDGASDRVAALASRVPGLDSGLWDNPAAAGVLAALAAAGLIFFVVVLWRFPKQLSADWR